MSEIPAIWVKRPLAYAQVSRGIEPDAIRHRIRIVAEALEIPAAETRNLLRGKFRDVEPLGKFALKYNQPLDWLLFGETGALCHRLAMAQGWRPAWWTPAQEAALDAGGVHV